MIWDLDVHHARDRIHRGTTVLDLGASVGDFAIPAQAAGAYVLAIEPYEPNAIALRKAGIPSLRAAVGPMDGRCMLIVPENPLEQPTGSFIRWLRGAERGNMVMLSLATLLEMFRTDVVKCDIEGGEYAAFLATPHALLRHIHFAAIEFHVWTVDGQERIPGIGHRGGEAMTWTPQQLQDHLAVTHDVEMDGNYEAGGTFFATLRQ